MTILHQIKLADKQAAMEKLEWEATTSTKKVEKLQEDLEVMQGEFSLFMKFVGELTKTNAPQPEDYYEDYDVSYPWDDQVTEVTSLHLLLDILEVNTIFIKN